MERKPEDIERDIDTARERLVTNLDEIAQRVTPEEIAKRTVANVQRTTKKGYDRAKAYYVDDVSGEIRQDRAMKSGAIALGLLVLRKLLK